MTALQIIGLTLLLLAAQAVLRNASKWVVWGLFAALPAVLLPYWVTTNQFDLFVWIKLFSVLFCNVWGTAVRFTRIGRSEWARRSIPVLVAVNIAEAMAVDVAGGGLAHGLNAAAGLALVLTLPYGRDDVRVDAGGRCRDLRAATPRGWVVGYTLWNWAFVLLNYPAMAGHHAAVLAAALVVGLIDPARWTQTRGATLGLNLLAMATIDAPMRAWLDTSAWANPWLALGVAAAGFAVAAGCVVEPVLGLARRPNPRLVRWWDGVVRVVG